MAAPKYLEHNKVTGSIQEVIATESGPSSEVIVSTGPNGTIDPSLLPASGSGINIVQVTVDFGHVNDGLGDTATVTVPASWVTLSSQILCNVAALATPDHDPEDVILEDIDVAATNLVAGVSFDISAYASNGTWGRYLVNAIGK
jgi:hypothetical protein